MCECRADIEAKLTKRHIEQNPSATEHSAHLMGYGFGITGDNKVLETISMPVEMRSTVIVKKTGIAKRKVDKLSMFFSYCPFCGEKRATK